MNISVRLLHDIGVEGLWANRMDVALQGVCLVATLLAVSLVDRLGSRRMMILGLAGTLAAFCGLSVAFLLGLKLLAASSLVAFAASYCLGPSVCVFLVMNELFPSRIRA